MNKYFLIIVLLVMSGCASLQTPKETNIAVSALLDEIQIAINVINGKTSGNSLPPFKNAEIVISTKAGTTKEGSASLVLSGGGKKSTNQSNTLTLTLAPNSSQPKNNLVPSTGQQLAEYVVEAVKAIDSKNYLELQKLVVEAGFTVSIDKNGGIEIEVASVSLVGKSSSSSSEGHTLKLTFEKPSPKKA